MNKEMARKLKYDKFNKEMTFYLSKSLVYSNGEIDYKKSIYFKESPLHATWVDSSAFKDYFDKARNYVSFDTLDFNTDYAKNIADLLKILYSQKEELNKHGLDILTEKEYSSLVGSSHSLSKKDIFNKFNPEKDNSQDRKYRGDKVYRICFDVQLDGGDVDFINSEYIRVTASMLANEKNRNIRNKFFNALVELEEKELLIQEIPNFDSFNLKTISGLSGLLEAMVETELYSSGIIDVETSTMYADNLRSAKEEDDFYY